MFFFVVLPISKPWILGALTLVSLEILADFGTVTIFAVDTFTTTIYKLWTGFFSIQTAQQFASLLLLVILFFFLLSDFFNTKKKYAVHDHKQSFGRIKLQGLTKWVAFFLSTILSFFTTVLPIGVLLYWVSDSYQDISLADFKILSNSAIIALASGGIATILAILLVLTKHSLSSSKLVKVMAKFLVFGYAVPGTVLAVSVFAFLNFIFSSIFPAGRYLLGNSLLVLFFGLAVRYSAIFTINLDKALQRIPQSLHDASLTLGRSGLSMFRRVHLPLLAPSILYTFLIVVIETLKEMPLTLMTRPFGWDTLAVKIFEFTSEGQWDKASYPALLLLLLGVIPIYFFSGLIKGRDVVAQG